MPRKRPDVYDMVANANDEVAAAKEESMEQEKVYSNANTSWTAKEQKTRWPKRYLRGALIRIFSMNQEEIAGYIPKNGFEAAAKAMFVAATSKFGTIGAWKEMRETLGEKVGTNWKATMDEQEDKPQIIMDIPTAERKQ